jgi:uncharacterized DUF497 family protein
MGVLDNLLEALEGFDWDSGNSEKIWQRHGVRTVEAEQVILNRPVVATDARHSELESRFTALGKTDPGRLLTVVFTMRGNLVRVISARPMSRAERRSYAETQGRT